MGTCVDKIRKYRVDYTNDPPNSISFIPAIVSTSGRIHGEFLIFLLFLWNLNRKPCPQIQKTDMTGGKVEDISEDHVSLDYHGISLR